MAKGIFNKFFEEVETQGRLNDAFEPTYDVYETPLTESVSAAVPETMTENIIEDIYRDNGLSDRSRSIYMVDIYMATLPPETPTEVKSVTVKNILKASGITEDEVGIDALKRVEVLDDVKRKVVGSNEDKISEACIRIEALKAQIEMLNTEIYEAKNDMAQYSETIDSEIKKINSLENFIKLGGGK